MLTISKPLSAGQAQSYHAEGVHRQGAELLVPARRHCRRMARPAGRAVRPCRSGLRRGLCQTQPGPASGRPASSLFASARPMNIRMPTARPSRRWSTAPVGMRPFPRPNPSRSPRLSAAMTMSARAHRESVRVALEQLEHYTQARIGGNHPPETTAKFIAAKFEHDTARPVDGYVAPQLHTHAVVFNVTERDNGQPAPSSRRASSHRSSLPPPSINPS
jgi:hypothetical protein